MRKLRNLLLLLILVLLIAGLLSVLIVRTKEVDVQKGFMYGPTSAQVAATTDGSYVVKYYGFPSTYREQHIFQPNGDVFTESSYDFQDFDWFYVLSNVIFWAGLFMALLAPLTIFYRPKKRPKSDSDTPQPSDQGQYSPLPPAPADKNKKNADYEMHYEAQETDKVAAKLPRVKT